MPLVLSIVKAVVGYFVLMFVGTNLIGVILRGFVQPSFSNSKYSQNFAEPKSSGLSILFLLITLAYLYGLYHFFNIGVAVAAALLIIARIPDAIFEIKTGEKINPAAMQKRPIDVFCTLLMWLALPLLWYSFYYLSVNI